MNPSPPHDLNWLAFSYVSGELSKDEVAAFELRLLDDQTAREAVASAVELTQAIVCCASRPDVAPSRRKLSAWVGERRVSGRRIRLMAGVVGLATCLSLIVVATRNWERTDSILKGQPGVGDTPSAQLAFVWSQTRLATDPVESVDDENTLLDAEPDATERRVTPSWVFAALIHLENPQRPDSSPAEDLEEL